MKGYKGFNKGLICRGKQYAEDTVFEEESAVICKTGMHFCELPHQVFQYYKPGSGNEFAEVEALDEVQTDDGKKFVTTKLKIGKKISVAELCKRSVPEFFKAFEFDKKIEEAKQAENYGLSNVGYYGAANAGYSGAANAGDYGAANAGDSGAANAGDCGAANAGDYGAANAGYRGAANAGYSGAANAGDYGAANAGDSGAANAGDYGAANAGYRGAANAGECGVAIVRENGISSVRTGGAAVAYDGWAKGEVGAALVLIETDGSDNIKHSKTLFVDGEAVKPDTYYRLKNGEVIEMEESK